MDVRRVLRDKKCRDQIGGRGMKKSGRQHIPLNMQGLFSGASGREGAVSLILFCPLSPFFSVALERFHKGK